MQLNKQPKIKPSRSTRAEDNNIILRKMNWSFPEHIEPIFIEGQPELSFLYIGVSYLFTYLEPYLIRSLNVAKKSVQEPHLLAEIDALCAQEKQHFQQHMRFNRALGLNHHRVLKELQRELLDDYQRFSDNQSLAFNLAYAQGFEAFTMATTRFHIETSSLDQLPPSVQDLFRWHLVEELEHRLVAFDVYEQVAGGYCYRLRMSLFSHWHLCRFALRVVFCLINHDRSAFRKKYGGPWRTWWRLRTFLWQILWRLLPKVLWTYAPWYTPHKIPMPAVAKAWGKHYEKMQIEMQAIPEDKL